MPAGRERAGRPVQLASSRLPRAPHSGRRPERGRRRRTITGYRRGDLEFEVRDTGPLAGSPVVLLHGFPERASHWDAVAERLNEAGLRTLAPDQRGYSPGARPRTREAYRMKYLVADVVALLELLGEPVHLVGHDWGAAVAWRLAASHPSMVRTLTTVSVPHPAAFARSLVTSSQALRSWYALAVQPPGFVEALARWTPGVIEGVLRASGLDDAGVSRFRSEMLDDGALSGGLGWYRAAALGPPWSGGPVRVPTTHVWSDGDVALARRGAELTGRHVKAPYELRILAGVTHWVPTQAPGPLADAVLDRVRKGAEPEWAPTAPQLSTVPGHGH
jgi:pimeloyl-ACP methyl ester carboxylesterase